MRGCGVGKTRIQQQSLSVDWPEHASGTNFSQAATRCLSMRVAWLPSVAPFAAGSRSFGQAASGAIEGVPERPTM